jgi:hypothetical protein
MFKKRFLLGVLFNIIMRHHTIKVQICTIYSIDQNNFTKLNVAMPCKAQLALEQSTFLLQSF